MSNTENKAVDRPKALAVMASRLNMDQQKMYSTLKNTVFKGATDEEMMVLVVTANEYNLNPFLKQIYAFPDKRGGIVPVVSIDGWASIVKDNKTLDGVEFEYDFSPDNKPVSCTCRMHLKNQSKPTVVTEYYEECFRATEPWKTMPRRMLRHKAYMQCARLAFGLGGIYDEDEARDIVSGPTIDIQSEVAKEPAMIPGVTEPDDVPYQAAETESTKATPAKTTAAPVKRKMPVRKQAPPPPEPTVQEEPPVDEEPPAEAEATEEEPPPPPMPAARKSAGSEKANADTIRELNRLMVESDVSEDQVIIFCYDTGNMDEGAVAIEDLTTKQVLNLIKTWKTSLPQMKQIEI